MVLHGVWWIVRTVTLAKLQPGAVEALIDGMEHRSSPLSWIGLHPFHGVGEGHPPGIDGLRPQGTSLHARDLRRLGARRGCSAPRLGRGGRVRAEADALPRLPQLFRTGSPGAGRRPTGRTLPGSYGSNGTTTRTACSPRRPCRCWPRRGRRWAGSTRCCATRASGWTRSGEPAWRSTTRCR